MRSNTEQKNGAIKRVSIVLAIASLVALLVMVAPMSAAMYSSHKVGPNDQSSNAQKGGGHPCGDSCVKMTNQYSRTYTTTTPIGKTGFSLVVKAECTMVHPYYVCQHKHGCSTNLNCEADGPTFVKPDGGDYATGCTILETNIIKSKNHEKNGKDDDKNDKHDDKKDDKKDDKNDKHDDKHDDKKDNKK